MLASKAGIVEPMSRSWQCEPPYRHYTEGIAKTASEMQLIRKSRYHRSFPLDDPQIDKLTGSWRIHTQSNGPDVAKKT